MNTTKAKRIVHNCKKIKKNKLKKNTEEQFCINWNTLGKYPVYRVGAYRTSLYSH